LENRQHGLEHLQARAHGEIEQLGPGVDEQIDERQVTGRFHRGRGRECARLLDGGYVAVKRIASV